jgi:hypothetical protein
MCMTFRPFRRQPPLTPWHRFCTLPLSLPGLQDLLVPVWASPSVGRLATFQAESRSLSCGLVVRLPLLLTPPFGDAITVDYRPESACLKWTSTTPITHTYGRTGSHAKRDGSPPRGKHLVRRYGLYSSRGRGTWKDRSWGGALCRPALRSRAPANWYGGKAAADPGSSDKEREVDAICRRRAWARLLAKVHAIDVLACPRCGSRMSVIAVITDPAQIRKIIDCLDRHGRGPPPLG